MLTSERLCREKSQLQNLWSDHTPRREERRGREVGREKVVIGRELKGRRGRRGTSERETWSCICSEVDNHVTFSDFSHLILSVRLKLVNYTFSDDWIIDNKTFQNIVPVHLEGGQGEGGEKERLRDEEGGKRERGDKWGEMKTSYTHITTTVGILPSILSPSLPLPLTRYACSRRSSISARTTLA